MTLLDRVRAAGNEAPTASAATRGEMLEWLKERVREQLPADDIASLAKGNPERARNEIRAVCRAAFEGSRRFDMSVDEQEALADTLIDSMLGFGPLEVFLADESITEIMVNGSRSLFYEREGVLHRSEFRFASDDEVRMLIDRIIGPLGRRIDESSPMVNARLAQGHPRGSSPCKTWWRAALWSGACGACSSGLFELARASLFPAEREAARRRCLMLFLAMFPLMRGLSR